MGLSQNSPIVIWNILNRRQKICWSWIESLIQWRVAFQKAFANVRMQKEYGIQLLCSSYLSIWWDLQVLLFLFLPLYNFSSGKFVAERTRNQNRNWFGQNRNQNHFSWNCVRIHLICSCQIWIQILHLINSSGSGYNIVPSHTRPKIPTRNWYPITKWCRSRSDCYNIGPSWNLTYIQV